MKNKIYDTSWPPNAAKGGRDRALGVLGRDAVQLMDFTFMGYHVTPSDYNAVATALSNGDIYVEIDYSHHSRGEYQSTNHTVDGESYSGKLILGVGTSFMSEYTQRALLIHEATHAALDLKSQKSMSILHSECLAYFAQQLYYWLITGDYQHDGKGGGQKFEMARKCVEKYVNGGWVDDKTIMALKASVMGDSDYGWGSALATANFNG